MIEWLAEKIKGFIEGIIEAIKNIASSMMSWISEQWMAMISWIVSILPPASQDVESLFMRASDVWNIFWKYTQLGGYFIHFPSLSISLGIILVVETVLLFVQFYLFIKRLIPLA